MLRKPVFAQPAARGCLAAGFLFAEPQEHVGLIDGRSGEHAPGQPFTLAVVGVREPRPATVVVQLHVVLGECPAPADELGGQVELGRVAAEVASQAIYGVADASASTGGPEVPAALLQKLEQLCRAEFQALRILRREAVGGNAHVTVVGAGVLVAQREHTDGFVRLGDRQEQAEEVAGEAQRRECMVPEVGVIQEVWNTERGRDAAPPQVRHQRLLAAQGAQSFAIGDLLGDEPDARGVLVVYATCVRRKQVELAGVAAHQYADVVDQLAEMGWASSQGGVSVRMCVTPASMVEARSIARRARRGASS